MSRNEHEHAPGTMFGRYVLLDRIGRGGMGVVYRAYDPELDRRVALKTVRVEAQSGTPRSDAPTRSFDARERLLREARAMARLSHPNVIAVHDVGSLGDEVFVAMELVDGLVLGAWLRERPRRWREVLAMFVQAGNGLAAAHRAGLVHRDFKPANVLVGRDGRARVLDFGLARAGEAPPPPSVAGSVSTLARSDDELTVTGALVGTPAYMAPEQHLGQAVDPRSDQFSFCVALYQGLVGARPFPGDSVEELAAAVIAGRSREPPAGSIPRFVRQALRRGLSVKPADRFPSMDALLAALGRDPRRMALPALAVLGGVSLLASGALTLAPAPPACDEGARSLAGVWDGARQAEVERAFSGVAAPFAEDAWRATRTRLDAYAGALGAMRREACEATHVRHEQSDELLDLRVDCLDGRLGELRALVEVLAHADRGVVERAPAAARALPAMRECADRRWLLDRVRPPADPARRARAAELERGVAEVRALKLAGKFAEGLALARTLAGPAAELAHRPTEARVLLALGDLTSRAGDPRSAADILARAVRAALAGRDPRLAAGADLELSLVTGVELAQADAGLARLADAAALLEGAGGDPELEARMVGSEGQILASAGRPGDAMARLERALGMTEKVVGPDDLDTANVLNDLGGVYRSVGRGADALRALQRALAIREKTLGPAHPFVASTVLNIGNVYYTQGKHAEAEEAYQRAVALREAALGPTHPRVAEALVSLAENDDSRGHRDEALAHLQRALAIQREALGPDHLETARTYNAIGDVERGRGHLDEALAAYRRSLDIKERTVGKTHASLAVSVYSIADILLEQGQRDEALRAFQRALDIDQASQGDDSPELAYDLTGIGRALIAQGKAAEAVAPLRRARALRGASANPVEVAETEFALARALWDARQGRGEALTLARGARAAYAAAEAHAHEAAAIDAWLAARR